MKYLISKRLFFLTFFALTGVVFFIHSNYTYQKQIHDTTFVQILPSPTSTSLPLPTEYEIPQKQHFFQTFNNCGPATLSMALSYLEIIKSQDELGKILRPYQIPNGDNDDKSVTLQELADYSQENGLYSYLRPNGTLEKLKKFIAAGIPVVTRTWLKADEDIGHYRVIRGYSDINQYLIQDDSLQGANLVYSYQEFENLWQPFNYEYLVIVGKNKKEIVEKILEKELDENTAWNNARIRIEKELEENPNNWHLQFALSRIYYYLGNFSKSVEYFNIIENKISFRTLWYQMEPLISLFEVGEYDRLLKKTEDILNNQNRAYSELYELRSKVFEKSGNAQAAEEEYKKAVFYNAIRYKPK